MKNSRTRRLIACALAAALLICAAAAIAVIAKNAGATPTVVFDANAKNFTFENVDVFADGMGSRTYPDLFQQLTDLMPGDKVTQNMKVDITGISGSVKYVKLYLRAEDPTANPDGTANTPNGRADTDFAKLMNCTDSEGKPVPVLTAFAAGRNVSGSILSCGTTAVLLGTFTRNGTMDLTVEFDLPKEAGNEFAGLCAEIDWVFEAEIVYDNGGGGEIIPDNPIPGGLLDTTNHFAYIIGRDDGLVWPEDYITRADVATIFFRMLTEDARDMYWSRTPTYGDVSANAWYNTAVSTLTNAGILHGYPDGNFGPNDHITRAEFAAVAARFFEAEFGGDDLFTDISDHWARDEINKAGAVGLIDGYGDGTFGPDNYILRAEAMKIVNNALLRAPDKDHLLDDMVVWPDNMDTDKWYYAVVQEATNSHDFEMTEPTGNEEAHELWTELQPVRDWAALEKGWVDRQESANPGEVISSAASTVAP